MADEALMELLRDTRAEIRTVWKAVDGLRRRVHRLEIIVAVAAGAGTAIGSTIGAAIGRMIGG